LYHRVYLIKDLLVFLTSDFSFMRIREDMSVEILELISAYRTEEVIRARLWLFNEVWILLFLSLLTLKLFKLFLMLLFKDVEILCCIVSFIDQWE
jgi:hypothetical protein